jgi:hypothetical protein
MKAEAFRRNRGILRHLALDHLLLHALDRRRRVEDEDVLLHQPIEAGQPRNPTRCWHRMGATDFEVNTGRYLPLSEMNSMMVDGLLDINQDSLQAILYHARNPGPSRLLGGDFLPLIYIILICYPERLRAIRRYSARSRCPLCSAQSSAYLSILVSRTAGSAP